MKNRHKRRQRRKAFTMINTLLLLACMLGLALIFYLYQDHSKLNLSQISQTLPKVSFFQHKEATTNTSQKAKNQDYNLNVTKTNQPQNTWTKQTSPVKVPILMYHAIHVMAPEEAANANLIVAPDLLNSRSKQ